MSTIRDAFKKHLVRGIFLGMFAILLFRTGEAEAVALSLNCGGWSVISTPGNGQLNAVASTSANDAWAVGTSGLIEHWNGTRWRIVKNPSSGYLYGVVAISKTNAWAVGYNGLIEHWNGKKWRIVTNPSNGTLLGIAAISANDIWAVGTASPGGPLTEHWNGTEWSIIPSPNVGAIFAVSAVSSNDVWAVAGSYSLHWDGTQWSSMLMPIPQFNCWVSLSGVVAISTNDIWAVGDTEYDCQVPPTLAVTEHWDGTQWSVIPNPAPTLHSNSLTSVAAVSTNNVSAVGYYNVNRKAGTTPLTFHWDGTSWTAASHPNITDSNLIDVAATPEGDFLAVGYYYNNNTYHTLAEFYC